VRAANAGTAANAVSAQTAAPILLRRSASLKRGEKQMTLPNRMVAPSVAKAKIGMSASPEATAARAVAIAAAADRRAMLNPLQCLPPIPCR
jgi:hypothetical protein